MTDIRPGIKEISLRFEAGSVGELQVHAQAEDGDAREDFSPPTSRSANLKDRGKELMKALFNGAVLELYALSSGRLRAPHILRLCFHHRAETSALDSLEWELLCNRDGNFLALDPHYSIVRRLERLQPLPPSRIESKLEILIVVADPPDRLDSLSEAEAIQTSFLWSPSVRVRILKSATTESLGEELGKRPIHVLHFIGHGFCGPDGGNLIFETDAHGQHPVLGENLRNLLTENPELRLIVLNACSTAGTESVRESLTRSVASSLFAAGFPAVIAMRDKISDQAAIAFSRGLYSRLASGESLDTAVRQGRRNILFKSPSSQEWPIPNLFLSGSEGYPFSPAKKPWSRRTVLLDSEEALADEEPLTTPEWVDVMAAALQISANDLKLGRREKGLGREVTLPPGAEERLKEMVQRKRPVLHDLVAIYRGAHWWMTAALGLLGMTIAAWIDSLPWRFSITSARVAIFCILCLALYHGRFFERLRRWFGGRRIASLGAGLVVTLAFAVPAAVVRSDLPVVRLEEIGIPAVQLTTQGTNPLPAMQIDASPVACHTGKDCLQVRYSAGAVWAGRLWWPVDCGEDGSPDAFETAKSCACAVDVLKAGNLRSIDRVTFWARGKLGGEVATFEIGSRDICPMPGRKAVVTLSREWKEYEIDAAGLNMERAVALFTVVATDLHNPRGAVFYLDDVQFEGAR